MTRPLLSLSVLALTALALAACGPLGTNVTQTVRTVEQTAIVPTPTGPHNMGRIPESGKVVMEGGYSGTAVFGTGNSRYEGSSGNIYANHSLRGRIGVGVGPGEIGIDFDYTNAAWGSAASTDLNAEDVERQNVFRAGPQFRGLFVGDRKRGFGGFLEFSLGNVPYKRVVYEKRTTTVFEPDPNLDWWEVPDVKAEVVGSRVGVQNKNPVYFFARAGLFGTIELIEGLNILPGMMIQNTPNFWGSKTGTETCLESASLVLACTGDDPRDEDPFSDAFMMTLFAAVSYQIGPFMVTGQLYGHPVADNFEIVEQVPFGGDLMMGFVF